MTDDAPLPTVRPTVEVGDVQEIAAAAATLWKENWTSFAKMDVDDLTKAAAIIKESHPHFGALEITKFFDLLNGKLRETGEYWIDLANQLPQFKHMHQEQIFQDTDPEKWLRWMGRQPGETIAACILTYVYRHDRDEPFVECNHVTVEDSMLYEYQVVDLPAPGGGRMRTATAIAEAKKQVPDEWRFHKVFFVKATPENYRKDDGWCAKYKKLQIDYHANATKKCRTTSARRALSRTFSLTGARVDRMLNQVQRALDGEDVPIGEAHRVNEDTVTHQPALHGAPGKALPPAIEADPSLSFGSKRVVEQHRKKMHTWLADRELPHGKDVHEVLKDLLAEIQEKPRDEVTTTELTYDDYELVCHRCKMFPLKTSKGLGAPTATTIATSEGEGVTDTSVDPGAGEPDPAPASPLEECVHNDDPASCDKCAAIEDRRAADEEATSGGQRTIL